MEREELVSNMGRPGSLKTLWSGKKPTFSSFWKEPTLVHKGNILGRAIADVCQIQPSTEFRF